MSEKVKNYNQKNTSKFILLNEDSITIDKGDTRALTCANKIKLIEVNMPSTQALKNFSLKLMQIKARLESGVN
ncbi:hypothetical protein [Clostridium estertheticum]|uniref:hypothetical protein n=1 Tax=Clostridium estertheticum TaxID=238834 RepID=UPI001C0D9F5A|nr:hypothetical protein [Clostridium estertheticum]MBU3072843.1 hypothetical protein [Clostridium estertheticum]MBU3163120.1 hypothetical protein [Clostridium estertheticum]